MVRLFFLRDWTFPDEGVPQRRQALHETPLLALKWVGKFMAGTVMTFGAKVIFWEPERRDSL